MRLLLRFATVQLFGAVELLRQCCSLVSVSDFKRFMNALFLALAPRSSSAAKRRRRQETEVPKEMDL